VANNLFTYDGQPVAGDFGRAEALRGDFKAIEAGFEKLKRHYLTFFFPDLNTPASRYLPALEAGQITKVTVLPDTNNATTATVITAFINGVGVTMPALSLASGALAGVAASVVPTAANLVTQATDILKISTDGGGSSVMPGTVVVEVTRA
jgi:hypothetical protein